MRTTKQIGEIIDGLGVVSHVEEGELVAGAVVCLKIVDTDGNVRMNTAWSDGMSWLERVGMLRVAESMDLPTDEVRSDNTYGEDD